MQCKNNRSDPKKAAVDDQLSTIFMVHLFNSKTYFEQEIPYGQKWLQLELSPLKFSETCYDCTMLINMLTKGPTMEKNE